MSQVGTHESQSLFSISLFALLFSNCWDSYDPYTNVLWLHYLVDKLLTKKTYNGKKLLKRAGVKLRRVYDTILGYKGGAGEFVEGDEFFDEIFNV